MGSCFCRGAKDRVFALESQLDYNYDYTINWNTACKAYQILLEELLNEISMGGRQLFYFIRLV